MLPTNLYDSNWSCYSSNLPIMDDYQEEWARLNEQELDELEHNS
jgi:hypothetical protein